MNNKLHVCILLLLSINRAVCQQTITINEQNYLQLLKQVETMTESPAKRGLLKRLKAYEATRKAAPTKVVPPAATPTPEQKRAAEQREAERRRLAAEKGKAKKAQADKESLERFKTGEGYEEEVSRPERGGRELSSEIERITGEVAKLLSEVREIAPEEVVNQLVRAIS